MSARLSNSATNRFGRSPATRNLVLHEVDLRDRIGIRHDLSDEDGPIFLKVDRLQRIDPPEPPPLAKEWITVGREPAKEPIVETIRSKVMASAEATRLVKEGTVDPVDVATTLKPKPGKDLKDVALRLDRFPEAKAAVEGYVTQTWLDWAQANSASGDHIHL